MRAYCKSKTLAERAAYEYGDDDGMRVMVKNIFTLQLAVCSLVTSRVTACPC